MGSQPLVMIRVDKERRADAIMMLPMPTDTVRPCWRRLDEEEDAKADEQTGGSIGMTLL
jgi:hypothetical protein